MEMVKIYRLKHKNVSKSMKYTSHVCQCIFLVAYNKLDAKQVDKQPVTVSKHHNRGKIDVNKSL